MARKRGPVVKPYHHKYEEQVGVARALYLEQGRLPTSVKAPGSGLLDVRASQAVECAAAVLTCDAMLRQSEFFRHMEVRKRGHYDDDKRIDFWEQERDLWLELLGHSCMCFRFALDLFGVAEEAMTEPWDWPYGCYTSPDTLAEMKPFYLKLMRNASCYRRDPAFGRWMVVEKERALLEGYIESVLAFVCRAEAGGRGLDLNPAFVRPAKVPCLTPLSKPQPRWYDDRFARAAAWENSIVQGMHIVR